MDAAAAGGGGGGGTSAMGDASAHQDPVAVTVHKSAKGPTVGTTTGTAVVVMAAPSNGKSDGFASQQYQSTNAKDDPLRTVGLGRNTYFLAVLAPNVDAAMQFLSNRPPGAHLLVKDEDDNLAVYVKFRQAVRAIVLIKAKELKKQDEPIEWGRSYRPPHTPAASGQSQTHSTMMTSVHKIHLATELYLQIEQCWKRFLPQVKAILLQMCCEPYLDEDAKLDDWGSTIAAAQSPCVVVLVPHSCGFYLLGTNNNASSSSATGSNGGSSTSAVPMRHVEFDFQKFVMVVADGTFNPTAFIVSTHFSSKRMFDADITFKLLWDNFLAPERVMLKETMVTTVPVQQTVWQNCVELNSLDLEFNLLTTLQSVCWSVIPHEPLPDLFLDSLRNMHLLFATSYSGENCRPDSNNQSELSPPTWPKEKIRMAAQIFPYLLELMVAAAFGLESIEANATTTQGSSSKAHSTYLFPKQKLKLLHQFARVLRFDIVHMINRCDEAMLYKFAHHIFQFFSMRCDLPAEFIELIRDLITMAPEFRALFMKNQGTNLLWKALHTGDRFQISPSSKSGGISPLAQVIMQANAGAAKPKAAHERRSSLFGIGKKTMPPSKSRKSIDFGTTFAIPIVSSVKPLVFLRINPLLVQSELISKLSQGQLEVSFDKQEVNSVGAKYAFCYCSLVRQRVFASDSQAEMCKKGGHAGIYTSCRRKKRSKLSPKMCMYELVLQLALELLFSLSAKTWERDVGLLLRLENIHESLSNEVMQQMKDAVTMMPKDEMILCPDHALLDQGNYCRIRVVIKCVSDLFRLELKRRNQMKTAIGNKKYWYLVHLFRTELREFNDYLESCTENEVDDEGSEDEDESEEPDPAASSFSTKTDLLSHIAMFRWIPKSFLDEWIVLSLEDLLQTATVLSVLLERGEASGSVNLEHIQYTCQLLQIFQLIMRRSTDVDLQTLVIRVLNQGCFPFTALLRQLATATLTFVDLLDIRASYAIQTEILAFLHEFLTLDLALPARNQWARNNYGVGIARSEDVEVLEQRKAVLMASILSSHSSGGHDEPSMWEYVVLTLVPKDLIPPTESASQMTSRTIPLLAVVRSFQQKLEPPELSTVNPFYFKTVEAFLVLSATFYASMLQESAHSRTDFRPPISSHMHYVALYNRRHAANHTQDSSHLLRRAIELHLKCIVALVNRRSQIPAITDAFVTLELPREPSSESMLAGSSVKEAPDATDPGQDLAPMLYLKLNHLQTSIPRLEPLSSSKLSTGKNPLLLYPETQALVVILITSFLIPESNFEVDEEFCPRFAISKETSSSSDSTLQDSYYDILWSLQHHLASAKLNLKTYEKMIRDLEMSLVIPVPSRISTIRLLTRLAAPSVFDRDIYIKASSEHGKNAENGASGEDGNRESTQVESSTESPCTYLTKGAFSTVHRSTPLLPRADLVAIKALAHQKRPGDMSVLSNLFNEVAVLKKLQGEPAAIQMLDFGNHHDAQNFEIMMEYCPCTVNEWRATLKSAPFRSLLLVVLRAYEHICQSLSRIHRDGVGHFDVKGDNVLIRTTPQDLTRRLLLYEERESFESEPTRFLKTSFCFGDFGESMIAESGLDASPRTATFASSASSPSSPQAKQQSPSKPKERCFFLSRPRGTEAIKSPEMLRVKGGESKKEKITFASDIWSMGCLLYELLTQELMFGNDDAAGLYTHLVISEGRVFRDDHERKINDALHPKDEHEKLFVKRIIALCEKILARSAKRLSIDQLLDEVRRLLEDLLHSSKSLEDKKYMDLALALASNSVVPTTAEGSKDSQTAVAEIPSLPSLRSRLRSSDASENDEEKGGSKCAILLSPPRVVACRFFWNLHVGGMTDAATSYYVQSLAKAGAGDRATSATTAFMDAFEAAHETSYDHFVYFLWDNDSNARFDGQLQELSSSQTAASLVNELSEENGRTCLFINSNWITLCRSAAAASSKSQQQSELDVKFFRQIDQEAHQLFPVFQRLLRNEPGSVLLLGVGRDVEATEAMNETIVAILLFFLQSTFSLGTTEALTFVARDCGQLFGYPSAQRLLELETYAARHEEVIRRVQAREKLANQRYVAQCLCGESVFGVPLDAMKEAIYHQRQQCTRNAINPLAGNTCFHPFPSPPAQEFVDGAVSELQPECAVQYENYPMDPRAVYEVSEERLIFPLESRSRRRDQVRWVEVDARSVERLDSLFGGDLAAMNPARASSSSNLGGGATSSGGNTAPLSSRTAQLSSRSSGPLIISLRERRKRWRRQAEEQQQPLLAGVGEHAEHAGHSPRSGMLTALTFGLKERAYNRSTPQQQTQTSSAAVPGGSSQKPRKLYECELCCFPICAISSDHEKVAIPLFFGRKAL